MDVKYKNCSFTGMATYSSSCFAKSCKDLACSSALTTNGSLLADKEWFVSFSFISFLAPSSWAARLSYSYRFIKIKFYLYSYTFDFVLVSFSVTYTLHLRRPRGKTFPSNLLCRLLETAGSHYIMLPDPLCKNWVRPKTLLAQHPVSDAG